MSNKTPFVFVKREMSILFPVKRDLDLDPPLPLYSDVGKRLRESQNLNQPNMPE